MEETKIEQTILPAFQHGNQLCVWCWHCQKLHFHGIGNLEASHKVAHCGGSNSPYHKTGYVVVPVAITDEDPVKIESRLKKATKKQKTKKGG